MNKLKMVLWSVLLTGAIIAAAVLLWIFDRKKAEAGARNQLAEELKAKVAALKAERDAQRAAAKAKAEAIEAAAQKEVGRDSVDAGNDLIDRLRAGSNDKQGG